MVTTVKYFILLIFFACSSAFAQDAAQNSASSEPAPPKHKRGAVIELEALTVEGNLQKPYAFFTLGRTKLDFRGFDPDKSFVERIYETVEEPPF